ncbi:anti-sigma factor family protein [Taibaiella helva]|uniref:anti-sigma factor family protein n=1 Tax=Taibaiella helva TaxID=2301235 RepID=UPI000E584795|nr:hypothetical protein [Taibaiella helva]
MKLTKENIEEYLLLLVDNELDAAEAAEVNAFVMQHEECRSLLELYRATKPDTGEAPYVFPEKESLLRQETPAMLFGTIKPFRMWRQAAAVALLLGTGLVLTLLVARKDGKEISSPSPSAGAITQNKKLQQEEVPKPSTPPPSTALANVYPNRRLPVAAKTAYPDQAAVAPVKRREREEIAPLAAATLPATIAEESPAPIIQAIDRESVPALTAGRKELPGWVPVKEESLDGVNDLVSQVQELRDNLAAKAKVLKRASFVIRIGDKDLIALGR